MRPPDIRAAMERVGLLRQGRPSSLDALVPYTRIRAFPKGSHVFHDRDEVEQVFAILQGVASLNKLNSGGDKRGIFLFGPGAMLNEEQVDRKPASTSCEVLKDAQILCIQRARFIKVCGADPGLSEALLHSMALKMRRMYHLLKNASNNVRMDRRIAARLWKLSRDYGLPKDRGTEIDFDLTITFLGELLGAQRETVSRQVKTLSEKGLVILDKNRFIIPSREKLGLYASAENESDGSDEKA